MVLSAFGATAQANSNVVTVESINTQAIVTMEALSSMALINWKVGDATDYNVSLGGFGMNGTMRKEATKEEGEAIWIKSELKLPIMQDTQEMLMDRNTGKVLKYLHNGKEENMPDEKVEIVKTAYESVTVPAGTYKCTHVWAKSEQVQDIQIWMNNRDIALDGAAKMYMDQGQIKITMELTKSNKQ
ncbi:MAG: hypothetical protein HY075_14385 [Deltaproteobacteria bacterium]|nr:hypothetical protein [Deltaproteobacteria bacterium]